MGQSKVQWPIERVAAPTGGQKRRRRSQAENAQRLKRRGGAYRFVSLVCSQYGRRQSLPEADCAEQNRWISRDESPDESIETHNHGIGNVEEDA